MKRRINFGLALILSTVVVTSPVLTFAAGSNRSILISSPKSDKRLFISKLAEPKRAERVQTRIQLAGQTTTPLSDGRTLLIGGEGSIEPQSTVFINDPRTQEITQLPNGLQQARAWHSATMLPDGKVLVLGGFGVGGKVISGAEIFDPDTRTSELVTSSGLTARAYHTATLLTTGQVLVVGGRSGTGNALARAELFDTKTRTAVTLSARLSNARQKHKATLLSDGNVLFEGGTGSTDSLSGAELYDPDARSFNFTSFSSDQAEGNAPFMSASLPTDGASDVPVDSRVAVRFSKQLRVESLNSQTVKLTSSEGTVSAKVVAAEGGRLTFVTPLKPLLAGTAYTLLLSNATDGTATLTPAAISFTTLGEKTAETPPLGDVDWIPQTENTRGNWRSNLERSGWQDQPPLQADPGVTALSGQVLTLLGKPLANVTISIDGHSAQTDDTGRFLLSSLSDGHRTMIIDGRTANRPQRVYGIFKAGVDITSGQTNVLPFTIWMPRLDMAHAVNITSPTTTEVVITNPLIPGLELHLPPGTVIRDLDGQTVTQISITPVPTDRPPFPLPPGFNVPVFASIQPGGARIIPPRARLIYPNYTNERPGARINFWNYDPEGKGWYIYGQGKVSPDGRQIIPDPGVVIYEFSGIMISGGGSPPTNGPKSGGGPKDGDPVDLGTGLFVLEKTDVALPDTMPIVLRRTYRPNDNNSRPFGLGSTHPYEMFLWSANNYQEADLILPDGGRIHYVRISPGTGFTDAVYEHTTSPSVYYKSQLFWNGNGWDLKLKDGTVYVFPDFAPLKSIRDRHGNQITITRSPADTGNITQITSPHGRWIQFTYDTSNRVTQAQDNIGRTVNYTYDTGGRLWKVTNPDGGVTEHTYDTSNRMLTIKDPRQIVYLTNQYDTNGRVIRQTQADNSTYEFAYTLDAGGQITQTDVTDPRLNVRRVTFNSNGYMLSDIRALGRPEQQTYTYERQAGTNLITSVTDALNRTTTYARDAAGYTTELTALAGTPDAVTRHFTYEPVFNFLATATDPLNHTVSFSYDSSGNLTTITNPLTHQVSFAYNSAGQVVSATDPLNHTTQFTYDHGDLSGISDPLNRSTNLFVDTAGRVKSVTNALGHATTFEYDPLNRLTKVTNPLQGATLTGYDPNGNLLSVTDARNGVTSFTYNNMDRAETWRDQLLHDATYQYHSDGTLQQATDRKGQITGYSYDALKRLTQVTFADSSTTSYTYDGGNRLTQAVDSVSGTSTFAYDNLDRLTSVTTPQGTVSYTYDSADRRVSMTVAGQPAVNYTYDNADRPTQITQGSATVTIAYDAAGRRTSLGLPNGITTEYAYDAASQLTGITYKNGTTVIGNLTYAYDAAGRRTQMGGSYARIGLPPSLTSATYNAANQQVAFGGQSITYDLNGNLTSNGTNTYSWNARDQMVSTAGPGLTASFQYDAFGSRISKTVNGATVTYLYDGSNLVQEQSGGSPSANILPGALDEVFTRTETAGTWSPLADGIGSTIALTDLAGAVQTEYTYGPFGGTTVTGSSNGNASQYTGRENDGTGLYYYRGRYYSPLLQRFISEDPIGFLGGINLYAYVDNNPISYRDPFGLDKDDDDIVDALKNFVKEVKKFIRDTVIPGAAMEPLGPILETLPLAKTACFVAGTRVQTASGDKPIEEVRSGDVVISTDPEKGEHASAQQQTVTRTFVQNAPVVLDIRIGQTTITATPEHPFWVVGKGWEEAGKLRPGSRLLTKGGNVAEVDKVERRTGSFPVYNFEVGGTHTYYVSPLGILVHNKCDPNKLNHIFNKPGRNLDKVVQDLGGQQQVMDAVQAALDSRGLPNGLFKEVVNVGGTNVTVTGNVINGVPRIGTMYP